MLDFKHIMLDKLRQTVIFVLLGVLVGVGTYRLAVEGKLPIKVNPSLQQDKTVNTQNQTVVKEENAIISVVDKVSSSVVAIGVTQRVVNPFDPFSVPRTRQSTIGTGFIVSDKGMIVTNRHVVADLNTNYSVVSKDGKKFEVTKIYRDPNLDLALVQISGSDLKPLELGDSSKVKVGQIAIAIGNALGRFDNTVTTGVISGLGRAVVAGDPFSGETERLDNLIQTDAAINPGNSGGPLLNSAGQVIGVNVATTEGAQNIGFAIPINSVNALVEEFDRTGMVSRAFLGVRYRWISRDLAILNEIPQGAYIQEVVAGSPADKAGIAAGDIIVKIDGQAVDSENKISEVIKNKKVGDKITLDIWNDGKTETRSVTLAEASGNL